MEYTNNVCFEDRDVKVRVFKDLIVEGDLVVHGAVTVHGYSEFQGPSAHFDKDFSAGKTKVDKHVDSQGGIEGKCSVLSPVLIRITDQVDTAQSSEMIFKGDVYGYGESLTCSNKGKHLIINGTLVVDGNIVARGPVRFHEEASLDGGAFFKNKPNVDRN